MAQAVSHRPLIAEALVRRRVCPCGICGGQSGTETGCSSTSFAFPCQYYSAVALHIHIISGWTIGPLVAAVKRRGLTPSTWTTTTTTKVILIKMGHSHTPFPRWAAFIWLFWHSLLRLAYSKAQLLESWAQIWIQEHIGYFIINFRHYIM
jgi:hypothetical protein